MTIDMQPSMAQSVGTSRSSFSSSNGIEDTPLHNSAAISNADDYDSDTSNFAPPTPTTLSMAIPDELAGAIPVLNRFQVEGFLRLMQKQIQSAGKRGFFSKKSVGPQVRERFTFEDMLCFQKDSIPTSLLKINSDLASRATKLFQIILKYMGVDSSDRVTAANLDERIELVGKLYKHTLKRSELRDELFVQILKQTRNNPDRQYLLKAWELMYLCASSMPPSKDIGGYLSEYVHTVAHGVSVDSEVRGLALNTLNALKHAVKAGPRHTIPAREEIEALLTGRKLTTIVFFLDETFEEITYDMATTVADAVEELAWIIKLSAYSSFSLFECRKVVTGSKSPDPGNEEYIGLDDNKYIGDLLAEFKAAKDQSEAENLHCNLTFKKKLFHESDEAVTDPMFVQLSYVQLQHDYILGNYPVGRDDAAQLSALQILVEIGFVDNPESCTDWNSLLERFLPRQNAIKQAKREWELDILSCYRSMEHLTKDDARQQFLRILRTLLYGNSVFFSVRKIDDPIGLLPGRIILGINTWGVHFFRPVPREYLYSAELQDIMQFDRSNTVLSFKMKLANAPHIFQFDTKQGEEICVALQTHINDDMLRRYSKACSSASSSISGDLPPNVGVRRKCVQDLAKAPKKSRRNVDQVALLEKKSMEARLAQLADLMIEKNTKKDLIGADTQLLQKLQGELKLRSEELHAAEDTMNKLVTEKISLEEMISGLEKKKADEIGFLEKKIEQERKALKFQVLELKKKLEGVTQELAVVESTLAVRNSDLASLQNNLKEFSDTETASSVKNARDGRSIPSYLLPDDVGPCTTRITYSAHTDLSVKFQSHQSRDYTDADLPIAPSAIDGSGQSTVALDGKKLEPESDVLLASIENMQNAGTLDVLHMDAHVSAEVSPPIGARIQASSSEMKDSLVQEYLKVLNTANKEGLKRLKGIGEKRATYILELRDEKPEPFKSLDDLKEIGLSEKQIQGLMTKVAAELFR